jgi:hypothetical protein
LLSAAGCCVLFRRRPLLIAPASIAAVITILYALPPIDHWMVRWWRMMH